jgi:hypothetical protein
MTILPSLAKFLNVVTTKRVTTFTTTTPPKQSSIDNIGIKRTTRKVLNATKIMLQVQSH